MEINSQSTIIVEQEIAATTVVPIPSFEAFDFTGMDSSMKVLGPMEDGSYWAYGLSYTDRYQVTVVSRGETLVTRMTKEAVSLLAILARKVGLTVSL